MPCCRSCVFCTDRNRFDIEFGLENGTTYNAYLMCVPRDPFQIEK